MMSILLLMVAAVGVVVDAQQECTLRQLDSAQQTASACVFDQQQACNFICTCTSPSSSSSSSPSSPPQLNGSCVVDGFVPGFVWWDITSDHPIEYNVGTSVGATNTSAVQLVLPRPSLAYEDMVRFVMRALPFDDGLSNTMAFSGMSATTHIIQTHIHRSHTHTHIIHHSQSHTSYIIHLPHQL